MRIKKFETKVYRQTDYIFTINKCLDINVITYLIDVKIYLNYNNIPNRCNDLPKL